MTKKRLFALIAAVSLTVIAVIFALVAFSSRPGVTLEDFDQLKPGMTQADTERLLSGPPRNDLKYPAIIWLPKASGQRVSAEIAPVSPPAEFLVHEDKPKNVRRGSGVTTATDFFPQEGSKSGHQAVWVSRAGLIAVYFGPDGILKYKYSSTVHESRPPNVFDWLASRPAMIRRSLGPGSQSTRQ
jgi:hypothetical protein